MPKNTKKRTKVKGLPRPEQELTAKGAKKVKGGLLTATQPTSLSTTVQKVKTEGSVKGSYDLGQIAGGLQ